MSDSEIKCKNPSKQKLGKGLADTFVKYAGFCTPYETKVNDLGCVSIIYDNSKDHITTLLPSNAHPFIEISHIIPFTQKQGISPQAIRPLIELVHDMANKQNIGMNIKRQGDTNFYINCQVSTTKGKDYRSVAMAIGGIDNLVIRNSLEN